MASPRPLAAAHEHIGPHAIRGPRVGSDKWYAMRVLDKSRRRQVVFGASEAAAACGVSPYMTRLELYHIKRGEMVQHFDEQQLERMRIGLQLEPSILELFERRTGLAVHRCLPMFFSRQHSFMGATPDGLAIADNAGVECKNTTFRMTGDDDDRFGDDGTDEVPIAYLMQAQQQMAVTGTERVHFPVLVDGSTLNIYTVPRCQEIIDGIAESEAELAQRIIEGVPPKPDYHHPTTRRVLDAKYLIAKGREVELAEETKELWLRDAELREQIKSLEAEREAIRNVITYEMANAEIGKFASGGIQLRRTEVAASLVTQDDVDKLAANLGGVKRAGHFRITGKKVKP